MSPRATLEGEGRAAVPENHTHKVLWEGSDWGVWGVVVGGLGEWHSASSTSSPDILNNTPKNPDILGTPPSSVAIRGRDKGLFAPRTGLKLTESRPTPSPRWFAGEVPGPDSGLSERRHETGSAGPSGHSAAGNTSQRHEGGGVKRRAIHERSTLQPNPDEARIGPSIFLGR